MENSIIVKSDINNSAEMKMVREKSKYLDQVGTIMDDPNFRNFFKEYFTQWGDAKAALMIMYTYTFLDDTYYEQTKTRLSSDELIYLIKNMMKNSDYRKIMVEGMGQMIKTEGSFKTHLEQILKKETGKNGENNIMLT